MSFVRLLAVPYFWVVLVVREDVAQAAVLLLVIGSTDWVDGFLARRLGQVSELGKFLDPLADRLMIIAALVGGLMVGLLPAVLAIPLLAREVVVGLATLLLALRGKGKLEVRFLGKVATLLLYGALPAFYLAAAGVAPWLFTPIGWLAGTFGLILYWDVGVLYLGEISRRLRGLESPASP